MVVSIKFQLTWNFPEVWDTDGQSHFIPRYGLRISHVVSKRYYHAIFTKRV